MDLGAPLSDVAASVRGLLLQHLARLEQPISRRKLASIAGVAPSNATEVLGELIVAGWTGSWTNIVGLPVETMKQILTQTGHLR